MKTCIIVNPSAGSVKDVDALRQQLKKLEPVSLHITSQSGEAKRLAHDAAQNQCALIIAAGGDGTLNEIINGVAEHSANLRVGLIPLGTGNDFARSLGIPTGVEEAIALIESGNVRAIDLVRVTSDEVRYFVNVSTGGFSGLVDEKLTPEMKQYWGSLAYLRSAAAAFPERRAYDTTLMLDETKEVRMNLCNVIIGNGRYAGSGIPVAPEAALDDGLLDVILIPDKSGPELAVLAAQVLLGTHLSNDAIIFQRASKIALESQPRMWFNADGELVGNEPAVFEVLPRAISFIAGKA